MGNNLVTGGFGFVGKSLTKHLIDAGEPVVVFDIKEGLIPANWVEDRVKVVLGDLSNWEQVQAVVRENDIDCIYHLGVVLLNAAETNPQGACMINVYGTLNILEAARRFQVRSVIYASSGGACGEAVPPEINEALASIPNTMYGLTKLFGERIGEFYHYKYNINFRSARFPVIIGAGGNTGISRYASLMIQEPALGRSYSPYVDESVKIPFMYIKDIVRAVFTLRKADEAGLKRRVYNLEGIDLTAGDQRDIITKYFPDAKIDFEPDEEAVKILNSIFRLDGTKAREDWGFDHHYTPEEAIEDFIKEVQEEQAA